MTPTKVRRRFTVRKQSSSYALSETFYIYDLVRKGRVTVWPHPTREGAQSDADELEIEAMVWDYEDDQRPYAVRITEARARFTAGETAR